jgi:chorismate mutase
MTPSVTPEPQATSIEEASRRIDRLDRALLDLLRERGLLSAEVRELRRAVGGPVVELARENAMIARYAEALGTPGTALALAVLATCRRVPTARS